MKLKQLIEDKNIIPLILFAVSALCSLILLVLYLAAGTNKLSPDLLPEVIVGAVLTLCAGIAIVTAALLTGKFFAVAGFGTYALGLYTFIEYIASQLNYISNVFYGVDGNSFTVEIVLSLVFALAGFVTALVGASICLHKDRKQAKSDGARSEKGEESA